MEYKKYAHQCVHDLQDKQEKWYKEFNIADIPGYFYSQESGKLWFHEKGLSRVECDILLVGSVSKSSQTWLWGWANGYLDKRLTEPLLIIKAYGEQNNYQKLVKAKWPCDEFDGWEMTAIAADHIPVIGSYRSPSESGELYMIVTNCRLKTVQIPDA